ncbi:MAG: hypothetical protein WCT02_04395 [Candidatus Paceibacterota bacterium]
MKWEWSEIKRILVWLGVIMFFVWLPLLASLLFNFSFLGFITLLVLGLVIAGALCIAKVVPLFRPAINIGKSLIWYAFFAVEMVCTIATWLRYDVKHMYDYWSQWEPTWSCAIYFMLPGVAVTIGATMAAITSAQKWKFSRRVAIVLAIIMLATGLSYGISDPAAKWFSTKKQVAGQEISFSESELAKKIGKYARVSRSNGAWVYKKVDGYYERVAWIKYLDRIARPIKEKEEMDGVYKLINVVLHDEHGEYTAKAFSNPCWIRSEDVREESRADESFHIKHHSENSLTVTFYTDKLVTVIPDFPIGTRYLITGAPRFKLLEPCVGDASRYFPVVMGEMGTNRRHASLQLKCDDCEPGTAIDIKIFYPKKSSWF